MRILLCLSSAACWVAATTASQAAVLTGPVTYPANGATYYLLDAANWTELEAEAITLGGHLATVDDAAENLWIYNTFSAFGGTDRSLAIGYNDAAIEGSYEWTSGSPSAYTSWAPGEPNNFLGDEDYAVMWHPSSGVGDGLWTDVPNTNSITRPGGSTAGIHGVVEVPVPEPTGVMLAGLALACFATRRKS